MSRSKPSRAGGRYLLSALVPFLLLVGAWALLSLRLPSAEVFLPSPAAVLSALFTLFGSHGLAGDVGASVWRVSAGFVVAVVVAVPLGVVAATFRAFDAFVQPLNDFVRYMPVAGFIPLTILWLGVGDLQKMAIIFLGTVFQLIPLVTDTVRRVPKGLLELGQASGASRWQVLRHVAWRWSLPGIYDHCRIALGWAWSYLVVAELVAARSGVGHMIVQSQRFIQTANVLAGILVIGILGLVFDQLFKWPRRRLFPWL